MTESDIKTGTVEAVDKGSKKPYLLLGVRHMIGLPKIETSMSSENPLTLEYSAGF